MQIRRNVVVMVAACAALMAVGSVEPRAAGDVRSETIETPERRVERLSREPAKVLAEPAALRGRDGEKEEQARVDAPRAADARITAWIVSIFCS